MNVNEIWKPVKDYEGLYEVSNYGNIRRIYRNGKIRILKTNNYPNGYLNICLCKSNIKKSMLVHRLVAIAFIPNPNNKKQVNHINGIKDDNVVYNLEWVTDSENLLHAFRVLKRKGPQSCLGKFGKDHHSSKPVLKYDLNNILITRYDGVEDASRITGIKSRGIAKCCRGQCKTYGGFVWKYESEKNAMREETFLPIGAN